MNFKSPAVIVALLITTLTLSLKLHASTMDAGTLLEFSNGNQIYGSTLLVNNDGTMIHAERTCCPPHSTPAPEATLSAIQLDHLKALIALAANQPMFAKKGNRTAEGSESGALVMYLASKPIVLHQILRGAVGESDNVNYNPSIEAQEIEEFVNTFVKHPLYK